MSRFDIQIEFFLRLLNKNTESKTRNNKINSLKLVAYNYL